VAYTILDEMKIIDFGWPWRSLTTSTVGYPSDSWASRLPCHIHLVRQQWFTTLWGIKNTPNSFYHKLKKGYPILTISGKLTHINDTTGYQMAV